MFYACYSLQSLDLTGWDTSNWAVTTLQYMFYACYSLQSIDLTGWDTSNWAVTTLAYMFASCYSLQSIDLTGWDTSNWAVTDMHSAFYTCYSLQSLDLTGWDTSNWAVTTLAYMFSGCYSLQSIDLTGWDTDGILLSDSGALVCTFTTLLSLDTLDLTGLVTSTTKSRFTNFLSNNTTTCIRYVKGTNTWVMDNVSEFNANTFNFWSIEEFDGIPSRWSFSLANATRLSRASLLKTIAALPQTTTALTITLGQTNKLKLTAAEIAVATAKGWTVA